MTVSSGCSQCPLGRDQYTGWGRLDIARAIAAVDAKLPAPDRLEPNDDAGSHAVVLPAVVHRLAATLDFWDDRVDVYRVRLVAGRRLRVSLHGPAGLTTNLVVWRPGTVQVDNVRRGLRAAQSVGRGPAHRIAYRVPATGWYYVEAKLTSRGFGSYTLSISR
jgi:hypothetical protein